MVNILPLICCLAVVAAEFYDTFTGLRITKTRYDDLQRAGLNPVCSVQVPACIRHERRRIDGSCNNPRHPQRGGQFTPFRRLLDPVFTAGGGLRESAGGAPLPLVRPLRVGLMADGRVFSHRHSMLVTMYILILVADVTSVHDTVNYVAVTRNCCQPGGAQDPRCLPIEVLPDDLHLRATSVRCLNLTRSITYARVGCIPENITRERINVATPMLDLSVVYGNSNNESQQSREYVGGRLLADVISGKEWPPSGGVVCVNNVPPLETRCHKQPAGTNALLGINMVYLWLFRQHNYIARQLAAINPCWRDNKLFHTAREINIALTHQIQYYELMTELLGHDFLVSNAVISPSGGHLADYDAALEPRVSLEMVTTLRWFHTVQDGRHRMYTPEGHIYDEVAAVDMILRTGALTINNTLAGLTQGAFRQPGAEVDHLVDPDLGERVLGRLQFVSDVISSDIMKGRDLGLAPYLQYRRLCALPEARTFEDLKGWMDEQYIPILSRFYKYPADIDLMAALLVERPIPGGWVPPTLACIMAEQLRYWRRADRFWYERPGIFTEDQLREIRKMSVSKLLCRHGDTVTHVQPRAFLVPGPGNELKDCSKYEMPDLNVFRDSKCHNPYPSLNIKGYTHDRPNQEYQESPEDYEDFCKAPELPKKYGYSFAKPLNCQKCFANPFGMYYHH